MRVQSLLRTYKLDFKGSRYIKDIAYKELLKKGCDIPPTVKINGDIGLPHPFSIVIHPYTEIGYNVKIYQNVTIGRGDIYNEEPAQDFIGFQICDGAIICAGAKIISSHGKLKIGKNSIVAANAVVVGDVPDNAIVGGIPAKLIGLRERS